MVLVIAILNDGTIMTISKDWVKPSPLPDTWKLREIFSIGVVIGTYLALMTVLFFWLMHETTFFLVHKFILPLRIYSELRICVATCITFRFICAYCSKMRLSGLLLVCILDWKHYYDH